MVLVGRFIKLAIMMGLVSQLMMSAYMTSMTLQRQGLEAAQRNFSAAVALLGQKVNSEYSLCLNGQTSDDSYKECSVCKALVGFGVYTLAALPALLPPAKVQQTVLPVRITIIAQDSLSRAYIRGPPAMA